MNRVRELVGASCAYRHGFSGKGIGIAVLDSGINDRHPDLQGRLVYSYNYTTDSEYAPDDCGHGTHISGIIGGTGVASGGRYQGLAPRCHFVSLKILDRKGRGESRSLIRALHWILEHGAEYQIRIVNISVGGSVPRHAAGPSALIQAVEEVWNAGYVVCAAAGNQGPERSSITVPGTSPDIITVGASDDEKAVRVQGHRKKHYSGRGPTPDLVEKPDLVAPGASILSCNSFFGQPGAGYYTVKSGTSMATPAVAGSLALLWEKEPELTNRQMKLRLCHACQDLGYPKNRQGCGRLWIPGLLELKETDRTE